MEYCEICGKFYVLCPDTQHLRSGGICYECQPTPRKKQLPWVEELHNPEEGDFDRSFEDNDISTLFGRGEYDV